VTWDELMDGFKTLVAPRIGVPAHMFSQECLRKIFDCLDADGDGDLELTNFDRFVDVCRTICQAQKNGMDFENSDLQDVELFITYYVFERLDEDNSGSVMFDEFWQNYDELANALGLYIKPSLGQAMKAFMSCDTDGETSLDFDEFVGFVEKLCVMCIAKMKKKKENKQKATGSPAPSTKLSPCTRKRAVSLARKQKRTRRPLQLIDDEIIKMFQELAKDGNEKQMTWDELMDGFETLVAPRIGLPAHVFSDECLRKIFDYFVGWTEELSVENLDRFVDVCRTVYQARIHGMDFAASDEVDVELFITRYIFAKLDEDNTGSVTFGEFWRNYDDLANALGLYTKPSLAKAMQLFSEHDRDGSTVMDFSQFEQFVERMCEECMAKMLQGKHERKSPDALVRTSSMLQESGFPGL